MLRVLDQNQYRIIADMHLPDIMAAGLQITEKLLPTTSKVLLEIPPQLARHLARDKSVPPHAYIDDDLISQSDAAPLIDRIQQAQRHGVPVYGVDVTAKFEQIKWRSCCSGAYPTDQRRRAGHLYLRHGASGPQQLD